MADAILPPQSELNETCSIKTNETSSTFCKDENYSRRSTIDEHHLEERRKTLTDQILSMRKGKSIYSKGELEVVLRETRDIDKTLKLERIDKELYDAYRNERGFFVSRALHDYDTMMRAEDAIVALEKEHNRSVAFFLSKELIHDSLEWQVDFNRLL